MHIHKYSQWGVPVRYCDEIVQFRTCLICNKITKRILCTSYNGVCESIMPSMEDKDKDESVNS